MSTVQTKSPVDEIVAFLLSMPTMEQIADYKVSDALDQRLHDLLDKNSNGRLSSDEEEELTEFLQMDHFLTVLKLNAELKLEEPT
jgi:hypothetical protein